MTAVKKVLLLKKENIINVDVAKILTHLMEIESEKHYGHVNLSRTSC